MPRLLRRLRTAVWEVELGRADDDAYEVDDDVESSYDDQEETVQRKGRKNAGKGKRWTWQPWGKKWTN